MNSQIKRIISKNHELIKYAIKLKQNKFQKEEKKVFVEGINIVNECIKRNIVESVFITEDKLQFIPKNTASIIIANDVAKKLSDVENSQNVFAIVKLNEKAKFDDGNILVLDDIQDPGNLGTLIRTAVAFNFRNILISSNTASPFNQKVIRSAQGLLFDVNIIQTDLNNFLSKLENYNILMTHLHSDAKSFTEVNKKERVALVLGNEGNGISQELLNIKHQNIIISINDNVESLNVASAGAIIMNYFYIS